MDKFLVKDTPAKVMGLLGAAMFSMFTASAVGLPDPLAPHPSPRGGGTTTKPPPGSARVPRRIQAGFQTFVSTGVICLDTGDAGPRHYGKAGSQNFSASRSRVNSELRQVQPCIDGQSRSGQRAFPNRVD